MNFQGFQASKVRHANLQSVEALDCLSDDERPVYVYGGDTYIHINGDGTYTLQLYREEWTTDNLTELEARLYVWCQTECPDAMGLNENDHAALCTAIDVDGGMERAVLAYVYCDYCDKQGLPAMSADELIFETLTAEQRSWVSNFIRRWEAI